MIPLKHRYFGKFGVDIERVIGTIECEEPEPESAEISHWWTICLLYLAQWMESREDLLREENPLRVLPEIIRKLKQFFYDPRYSKD